MSDLAHIAFQSISPDGAIFVAITLASYKLGKHFLQHGPTLLHALDRRYVIRRAVKGRTKPERDQARLILEMLQSSSRDVMKVAEQPKPPGRPDG